jgi:hypothetical protein
MAAVAASRPAGKDALGPAAREGTNAAREWPPPGPTTGGTHPDPDPDYSHVQYCFNAPFWPAPTATASVVIEVVGDDPRHDFFSVMSPCRGAAIAHPSGTGR